ncbi:MAG: hypothetical protein IKX70_07815 [Treponema sp.]|nr:hypothetical protein [Treponema sp.]
MNNNQWKVFCEFRSAFKQKVLEWTNQIPQLSDLQKNAAVKADTPEYPFENAVVYNTDLDKITADDEIKLIVIGDNPGKDEQLNKNQRYLCGQAGKLADGFFKNHPELGIDFRRNVIILNKTPVHSAKTAQLKIIIKEGGPKVEELILTSQKWMAEQTAKLHQQLGNVDLWLVGYSELKEGHFFCPYRDTLQNVSQNTPAWKKVFVYQHFSMNRFSIDLKDFAARNPALSLKEQLAVLGTMHKDEIFICQK